MMPVTIDRVGDLLVVRDDLMPGGTKARVLPKMLAPGIEYVYASPAYGFAQVALAHSAAAREAFATVFVAKRKALHPRTDQARLAGAKIVQVPTGYLSNVQAKARAYCEMTGATFLPFGFDTEDFVDGIAAIAASVDVDPPEVWSVAGSGVLQRALQRRWPNAAFHAVAIGQPPNAGRAHVLSAPERFEQDARIPPPFPSCSNYDAKAWQFLHLAQPGALFWNVAS